MTQPLATLPGSHRDERWRFLRDVLVFQVKMLFDNLRDFALMPLSLGAALIDLVSKGEREGALFYKVLHWGAHSEKVIDVYSAIERDRPQSESDVGANDPSYTIDTVVARLEGVLMREYEKGGTAATIKSAMDRAIDQLHRETSGTRDKAAGLVTRAAEKFRTTLEKEPPQER